MAHVTFTAPTVFFTLLKNLMRWVLSFSQPVSGVSFAILLMNLLVPYIEVGTRQAKLGIAKAKKGGDAK